MLRKALFTVVIALSGAPCAQAVLCLTSNCVRAPEIDPASAVSALAVLGAAIAIVRGRRRPK